MLFKDNKSLYVTSYLSMHSWVKIGPYPVLKITDKQEILVLDESGHLCEFDKQEVKMELL